MQKLQRIANQRRELGLNIDTAQYEWEMKQMQKDLDNNVDKGIQSALNKLNAAEIE